MVSFIFHTHTLPFHGSLLSSSPSLLVENTGLTKRSLRPRAIRPTVSLRFKRQRWRLSHSGQPSRSARKEIAACLFGSDWSRSSFNPVTGTGQPWRLLRLLEHTDAQSVCPGCQPRTGGRRCRWLSCYFILMFTLSKWFEGKSALGPRLGEEWWWVILARSWTENVSGSDAPSSLWSRESFCPQVITVNAQSTYTVWHYCYLPNF